MAFKPGQSGNPSGRPKGVKDKRATFKLMIEPCRMLLVQKAIDMALDGNEAMLKLLLERVLPVKLREDPVEVDIKSDSLVGQANRILEELAIGNITPSNTKILMDAVALKAKIIESEELTKRVEQLEQNMRIGFTDADFVEESLLVS